MTRAGPKRIPQPGVTVLVGRLRWSPIIWNLRGFIAWFTFISTVAVALHLAVHRPQYWGISPDLLPPVVGVTGWFGVDIPFAAIGTLGVALAVFLAVRNLSAYQRWWEARKMWDSLVSDSRSWCRQCVAWLRVESGAGAADVLAFRRELIHRQLAFVHGLVGHLRKEDGLVDAIEGFLPPDEADYYRSVPNVPTALLIRQGVRVAELRSAGILEHFRHLKMDDTLTRLSDIQGKCERIKDTPLPRQYEWLPRPFVLVFGSIMPFGLAGAMGWAAIPLSVAIALLFVLVEKSGQIMEKPFEGLEMDTPMSALATTIERDLRTALEEPLPDSPGPDGRGVLL